MSSRIVALIVGIMQLAVMGAVQALTTSGVGGTPGKFEVSSGGAATYSVPIQAPPGINGMEPKLALVYNSQGGNGVYGVGWSLSGVSSIGRCPASIAVDGVRAPINFTVERFCLNGQRLINVTPSGVTAYREYNTEIDSFVRVRAFGPTSNPDYFQAWTKDGITHWFGRISTSTTDYRFCPGGCTGPALTWPLVRAEDTYGNYIAYSYTAVGTNEYYLSLIGYGDKNSTTLNQRSITFTTDSTARTDKLTGYVAGKSVATTQRIKTITTKLGAATVRTYTLGYGYEISGAARTRINSLTETGSDGVSYTTPLSFVWRSVGTANATAVGPSLALPPSTTGLGQWTQVVDMNGDGWSDVVVFNQNTSVTVHLGGASGWAPKTTPAGAFTQPLLANGGFNDWNELADMNGDGVIDIFRVVNPSATRSIAVYRGKEDGTFDTANPITLDATALAPYTSGYTFRHGNQLIDMNGDGLVDIVRVSNTSFYVSYGFIDSATNRYTVNPCVGTPVTCAFSGLANSNSMAHGFRQTNQFADMDGDGIVDVLRVKSGASSGLDPLNANIASVLFGDAVGDPTIPGGTLRYTRSGQDQTGAVTPILFANGKYAGYFNYYNQLADVNGDGIVDIARASRGVDQHTQLEFEVYRDQIQPCDLTTTLPCTFYKVTVTQKNLDGTLNVQLGDGAGRFGAQISTSGLVSPISLYSGGYYAVDFTGSSAPPGCTTTTTTSTRPVSSPPYYADNITKTINCPPPTDAANQGLTQWNRFADVDGDGYVDWVAANSSGTINVYRGKGDGTFSTSPQAWGASVDTTAPTAGAANFGAWSQLADLNGDGIVDLFRATAGNTAQRYISNRAMPSLVEQFKDGLQLTTKVTYAAQPDNNVYTRTSGLDSYPTRKTRMPSYLVSSITNSSAPSGTSAFSYTYSYRYRDARVDMRRGSLGFQEMATWDANVSPNLGSITTFRQDFPFTGRAHTIKTQVAGSSSYISTVTNNWAERASAGNKVHFPYLEDSTQNVFEPTASNYLAAYRVVTDYQDDATLSNNFDIVPYDQYGNPEKIVTTYVNTTGSTNVTDYTAETRILSNYNAAGNFRGQLTDQTLYVKETPNGGAARTRAVKQTYNGNFQVSTSVTQPGASDEGNALSQTTSYGYDPVYGVITSETHTGADTTYNDTGTASGAGSSGTRGVGYAYSGWDDSDTLTVTVTTTGSGLTEKTLYSNKYSGAKLEYHQVIGTDTIGAYTKWNYDGFGRAMEEVHNNTGAATDATSYTVAQTYTACTTCVPGASYYVTTTTKQGVSNASQPNLTATVVTQYDALQRELRTATSGLTKPIWRDTQYDSAGRVSNKSRPYFSDATTKYWQQIAYDTIGRVSKVTEPNGAYTSYAYDRLTTTATKTEDGQNKATVYVKDSKGQVKSVKDPNGKTTTFSYGAFGVVEKITDPKNNQIISSYDIFGNKLSQADPNLGTWLYRYNAFGELKWQKDANSKIVRYGYDLAGRMISRVEGGTAATYPSTAWTYDTAINGKGRVDNIKRNTSATDAVTKTYLYDVAGRVNAVTVTQAGSTTGTYNLVANKDRLGRLSDLTYPAAALKVWYCYDPTGLLKKILKGSSCTDTAATVYWSATAYNAEDQLTAESWFNGITGTRDYYPDTGATKSINAALAGVYRQNWTYDYYQSGDLKTQTNNVTGLIGTDTYTYDILNRLKFMSSTRPGVAPQSFAYDDLGNITYKSGVGVYSYGSSRPHAVTSTGLGTGLPGDANNNGAYDSADPGLIVTKILQGTTPAGSTDCTVDTQTNVLDVICTNGRAGDAPVSTTSYSYDNNGNMLSGGGRSYTYNGFNMTNTITQGTQVTALGYGPDYRRLTKSVAVGGVTSETTTYIEGVYEKRVAGANTTHRYYVQAGGRLVAIVVDDGSGQKVYSVHTDRLGSRDVTADSTGAVVNDLNFDAWGKQGRDDTTGIALVTPRGYTGAELDADTGLQNLEARFYDPVLGRFTAPDTIVPDPMDSQSYNRYSYVLNNPYRYTDPTGHEYIGTDFSGDIIYFNDGGAGNNAYATYDKTTGTYLFANGSSINSGEIGSELGGVSFSFSDAGQSYFQEQWRLYDPNSCVGESCGKPLSAPSIYSYNNLPEWLTAKGPVQNIQATGEMWSANWYENPLQYAWEGIKSWYNDTPRVDKAIDVISNVMPELKAGAVIFGGIGAIRRGAGEDTLEAVGVNAAANAEKAIVNGKRSFSAADRAAGFEKAKDASGTPRCQYCGAELIPESGRPNSYEADHTQAYARGGLSVPENLTPSCRTCNRSKGAKTLDEWGGR